MQRNIPMPALYDAEFPKQRMQAAIERVKYAQSERDWRTAETYVEREIADMFDRHRVCALSRCRRARHCIGNAPLCWGRRISEQHTRKGAGLDREGLCADPAGTRSRRARRPSASRAPAGYELQAAEKLNGW